MSKDSSNIPPRKVLSLPSSCQITRKLKQLQQHVALTEDYRLVASYSLRFKCEGIPEYRLLDASAFYELFQEVELDSDDAYEVSKLIPTLKFRNTLLECYPTMRDLAVERINPNRTNEHWLVHRSTYAVNGHGNRR